MWFVSGLIVSLISRSPAKMTHLPSHCTPDTPVKVHVLIWPLWVRVISETLGQLIGFLLMFRAQLSKKFSPVGKIRKIDIPRPGGSSATLMVYI